MDAHDDPEDDDTEDDDTEQVEPLHRTPGPRRVARVNWPRYLRRLHESRPGMAEQVLSRSVAGEGTPYRWLARAVSDSATRVLDLACGSGPMTRELERDDRLVVGVDIAAAELTLAASRHPGPWLRADALRLPFADASLDAVTSSMGLVVITPLAGLVKEIARVLKPGGVLAAIAPTLRPLAPSDVRTLAPLTTRLRTRPLFPAPVELTTFKVTLAQHGMRKVEDARERYRFTVASRDDAEQLLAALYLPHTHRSRVEATVEYLERRLAKQGPIEIAIPMRRLVAIK